MKVEFRYSMNKNSQTRRDWLNEEEIKFLTINWDAPVVPQIGQNIVLCSFMKGGVDDGTGTRLFK
jgi:hypothetical protein